MCRSPGERAQQLVDVHACKDRRLVGQHDLLAEVGHVVVPEAAHTPLQASRVGVERLESRVARPELVPLCGQQCPG